ncbi:hypothetical protein GE061_003233 [Apolygus lucorum]|uniref:C-type lectin domain-containing protein n=1 Tax=Apolygus lucorum TaxID=248454 RepID=A0A8S9X382_APOLU|nr:hypothetical protein GE061_003233 [Apolygus lucorum]
MEFRNPRPGYREENSYWVGATDRRIEGDFQWTDSLPFTYTNWYEGQGEMNKQPNDDGLSAQDCLELRRKYSRSPPHPPSISESFKWNDRNCDQPNYYICQRLASGGRTNLYFSIIHSSSTSISMESEPTERINTCLRS